VRYRKIASAFWNDAKVRTLTDDGKLGFLFILTHPGMTAVGAMRGTLDGLAAELGWSSARFRKAILPAAELGMLELNEGAAFVGLPNFLRYNLPESPNVARSWVRTIVEQIPECDEKHALITRCRAALGESGPFRQAFDQAFAEAFGEALPQALPKGMANPEQEQEQEQRTGAGGFPPTSLHASGSSSRNGHRPARSSKGLVKRWRDRQPTAGQ